MDRPLAERHAKPNAPVLAAGEIVKLRGALPDWKIVDHQLTKTFVFADFQKALDFVNRAGALAAQEQHHPDIYLSWGRVDIKTSTRDAGGLTENDFILAARIDRAYFAR